MPAKKHNFTLTEIKAGAMVLAAVFLFLAFLAAARNWQPVQDERTYVVYASDTGGLNEGAEVRFGGVMVGRITEIEVGFDETQPSKIRLAATVNAKAPINTKSEAYIGQTTLTSPKHLEITTGADDGTRLEDGATIDFRAGEGGIFGAVASVGNEIVGAMDTVNDLLEEVNATVEDVRLILGVAAPEGREQEVGDLKSTLSTLFERLELALDSGVGLVDDARGVLEDNRETIRELLDSVKSTSQSAESLTRQIDDLIAQKRDGIDSIIDNVDKIAADIQRVTVDLDSLVTEVEGVIEQVDSISTTADGLVKSNSPVIDDLLVELREAARNIKEFSRTLKENPNSAIFGATPQGRRER